MTTITNQNLKVYTNIAFTMALSANTLLEITESQDTYDLEMFQNILAQLNWIAGEQKEIVENILACMPSNKISPYFMLLKSISTDIEAQTDNFTLSFTQSMLARKVNKDFIKSKSYVLSNTIQSFYETLKSINADLCNSNVNSG
jgi:hypothetical protein